jgi:chromosome segregation ATPase
MSNETVTYSLEAVLTRIENKIDTLQKDVNQKFDKIDERLTKLEIGQATLTEKVDNINKRLEKVESEQSTLIKSVSDLQGFRGLILPLVIGAISAGIGAIITVATRIFLLGNNP